MMLMLVRFLISLPLRKIGSLLCWVFSKIIVKRIAVLIVNCSVSCWYIITYLRVFTTLQGLYYCRALLLLLLLKRLLEVAELCPVELTCFSFLILSCVKFLIKVISILCSLFLVLIKWEFSNTLFLGHWDDPANPRAVPMFGGLVIKILFENFSNIFNWGSRKLHFCHHIWKFFRCCKFEILRKS